VNESGLTLLEVVVSLALIAFILGVMSEFLYNGVRFWTRNAQAYQRQHQLQSIYQTLHDDLESAFSGAYFAENSFKGEPAELKFWRETACGLEQTLYRFDREARQVTCSSGLWGVLPESRVIFTGIKEWEFAYFDSAAAQWQYSWNPSAKAALPALVRLTVTTARGGPGVLVFPLYAGRTEEAE
jgi:type II secretory pathway pseudopilin PulG